VFGGFNRRVAAQQPKKGDSDRHTHVGGESTCGTLTWNRPDLGSDRPYRVATTHVIAEEFGAHHSSRPAAAKGIGPIRPTTRRGGTVAETTYNGYCVKCKEKRDFEGTVEVSKTGMNMAKGKCPVCGTTVNRILGKAKA
jgi:hypothetical protein